MKMPDQHRRMAISLMTRWFEHVQVGSAFSHTIFVIFSEDSPLGVIPTEYGFEGQPGMPKLFLGRTVRRGRHQGR